MGVDAKLFVTSNKALEVYSKVKEALNVFIRKEADKEVIDKGYANRHDLISTTKEWSNGISSIDTYDFRSFHMHFKLKGEQRSLFCTHGCSNDYSDTYQGDKIIFSLGYWGLSDEIMTIIAEALKEFGDVYYDFNDCDEFDFEKISLM